MVGNSRSCFTFVLYVCISFCLLLEHGGSIISADFFYFFFNYYTGVQPFMGLGVFCKLTTMTNLVTLGIGFQPGQFYLRTLL